MMQDFVRTATYHRAILQNHIDFKDKVSSVRNLESHVQIFAMTYLPALLTVMLSQGHNVTSSDVEVVELLAYLILNIRMPAQFKYGESHVWCSWKALLCTDSLYGFCIIYKYLFHELT